MQDKVVEALFHAYFAEEKFLNDPEVLKSAAVAAGIPEDQANEFVTNEEHHSAETTRELQYGRERQVTGVPYFVVDFKGQQVAVSGAQPPEAFEQVFSSMLS